MYGCKTLRRHHIQWPSNLILEVWTNSVTETLLVTGAILSAWFLLQTIYTEPHDCELLVTRILSLPGCMRHGVLVKI